jgi:hypothetical protein
MAAGIKLCNGFPFFDSLTDQELIEVAKFAADIFSKTNCQAEGSG